MGRYRKGLDSNDGTGGSAFYPKNAIYIFLMAPKHRMQANSSKAYPE